MCIRDRINDDNDNLICSAEFALEFETGAITSWRDFQMSVGEDDGLYLDYNTGVVRIDFKVTAETKFIDQLTFFRSFTCFGNGFLGFYNERIIVRDTGGNTLNVIDRDPNGGGVYDAGSRTLQITHYVITIDEVDDFFDVAIGPHSHWMEFNLSPTFSASEQTLFRGVNIEGGLPESRFSDDQRAKYNPGFVLNDVEAPVWLIYDADVLAGFDYELTVEAQAGTCLLYTSPSPRDRTRPRMPSSA